MKTIKTINKYTVSENLWKKFGTQGQIIFNETMDKTIGNQGNLIHPKQKPLTIEHWGCICHNISCIAAFNTKESL